MQIPYLRSVLIILGLSFGSGLLGQQEYPTYQGLLEEQRIILNAYLVRAENPYVLQAEAQLGKGNAGPAEQNALTAVLLLGRARERLNEHPTKIEQARNAFGFRLSEGSREELRNRVRKDIDPRYFALQTSLQDLARRLAEKGVTSVQRALKYAQDGNSRAVEELIIKAGGTVEKDVLSRPGVGGTGTGGTGPGGTGTGGTGPGGTGPGGTGTGGVKTPLPNLPGATIVPTGGDQVTITLPDGRTIVFPGTFDGRIIITDVGKIDPSSIRRDQFGNIIAQSDRGPVYLGPDGKWHLGTPPRPAFEGQEISDSDLQDGVLRKYIGEKGGLLISEQRIALVKNADGSPKIDGSGNISLNLGERRLWKFRLNPGEQKSAGGAVQQTITLVEDGGSSAFTVTGWDVVSQEGRRATAEVSRTNPNEATVTFPANGNYVITVSGTTSGWEKGSAFRVKGNSAIFQ